MNLLTHGNIYFVCLSENDLKCWGCQQSWHFFNRSKWGHEWSLQVSLYSIPHISFLFILYFARMERDSSNDADMFEDSSGRESEATCGLSDVPTISNSSKNSKSLKVYSNNLLLTLWANSTKVIFFLQRPALDEECLMPMSEEELDFFEKYRDGKL